MRPGRRDATKKIVDIAKIPRASDRVDDGDFITGFERFLREQKRYSKYNIKNIISRVLYLQRNHGITTPTAEDAGRIRRVLEERELSNSTIKHVLRCMELMAECQGRPFQVGKPKQVYRVPDVLDQAEARRLIDAAGNRRDQAIISLLLYTGLRSRELCELRLMDVDLHNRLLWIRDHGQGIKNRHERKALISRESATTMKAWLDVRPVVPGVDHVFFTQCGRQLCKDRLNRIIRDNAGRAGITKRVHAHMLRHSCGSAMVRAGVPITEVQLQLGHRSLSSTLIYVHGDLQGLRESVDRKFRY